MAGITFAAGVVASAICPCTLPVGLGIAGMAGASEAGSRRAGLQIAVAFFAGIVVSLVMLGALAGRIGALATESFGRNWALAMAILSLLAALLAFWWPRMKLDNLTAWRRPGVLGAFGYGLVFSVGTRLCFSFSPLQLRKESRLEACCSPSSLGSAGDCRSSPPASRAALSRALRDSACGAGRCRS